MAASVVINSCISVTSAHRLHDKLRRKEREEKSVECRIKSPTWRIRATLDGGEQQAEVSRLTDAQQETSSASTEAPQFPSVDDELRLNRRLAIASVVSGAGLFVANRVSGLGADLSTLAARSISYDEVSQSLSFEQVTHLDISHTRHGGKVSFSTLWPQSATISICFACS